MTMERGHGGEEGGGAKILLAKVHSCNKLIKYYYNSVSYIMLLMKCTKTFSSLFSNSCKFISNAH